MLRELLAQTIYAKRKPLLPSSKSRRSQNDDIPTTKLSVSSIASTSSTSSRRKKDSKKRKQTRSTSNSSVSELAGWLRLLALISDKDQEDIIGVGDGEHDAFIADGEIEDDRQLTRDKLLSKIREKKAVIEKLRCQPWPMRRKRRTLILAQKYLQRHESKVSKTHLLKEAWTRKWKKFRRWLANVSIYLIPWEAKIKTIESHFGSVVSSYFTFLRWIFWVNVIMTLLMVSFIVIPECLADTFPDQQRKNDNDTRLRKHIDPDDVETADYFHTVWNYRGYITVSPLFYGYYSNRMHILSNFRYELPLAYFLVNLFTLGYSFFAILRKMASNTRMSKLTSGKTEQYPFGWKLFTGWDYTIGNAETAANTFMANANKLREAIMEFKTKQKEKFVWVLLFTRVVANILILGLIAGSTYVVNHVVREAHMIENPNAFEQNQVAIVVSFITLVFPNIFELISRSLERFHPRTSLRVHLGRILALYLLNFYSLIFALITNISKHDPAETATPSSAAYHDLSSQDSSIGHYRFGRSLEFNYSQGNDTSNTTFEPLLHMGALLLNIATTGRTAFLSKSTSNSSIPILLHLLKTISSVPGESPSTTSSLFPTRVERQTARNQESYYRYKSGTRRRPRTTTTMPLNPVTGPLSWTTMHPMAGRVGVNDANAYLLDNITEWMRKNINDLETFPPLKKPNTTGKVPGTVPWRPPGTVPSMPNVEHGQGGDAQQWEATGNGVTQPGITATKRPPKHKDTNGRNQQAPLTHIEKRLRCWETWVGQEIAKLITMDLVMTIASILVIDFFRGLWVRYCSRWWCWNLETVFPEYGEFKVAENVLHIINNQGMIWLGLFFCPLLPAINNVKLIIIMYVRGWACMTCNVPATQVFRASRSSNFYFFLLLLMLFLCTLPVGYVIAQQTPSARCGPFSDKRHFYNVITDRLQRGVPDYVYDQMESMASPGIVIPILVLLGLIIYFLISLIRGLRAANQDLQKQLVHERTEEKRKIYQLAGGGKNQKGPAQPSFGLPETKKVDLSHLPDKEKNRRETWRSKPSLSDDESVIRPTDTDLSSYSPSIDTTTPASPSRPGPGYPDFPAPPSSAGANSPSAIFIPSLKSLPEEGTAPVSEVEDEDDDRQKLIERSKSDTIVKPQVLFATAGTTSKSAPETTEPEGKRESYWEPARMLRNLLSPQQPQPPPSNSISLVPYQSGPSRSTAARFPTSADASISLTGPTPSTGGSLSPTDYDNNYPTPKSVASPSTPDFGVTAQQVAAMLSPTQFSPTRFDLFMRAPKKKKEKDHSGDWAPPSTIQSIHVVKTDVLIHMADETETERYPSDSGRATMTESGSVGRPARYPTVETDTGAESDMERFARNRAQGSPGALAAREPTERDRLLDEEEEAEKSGTRPKGLGPKPKETKLFPKPISSNFVPWPAPDPLGPKSTLKHHGPPNRRESCSPSPRSPTTSGAESSPFPKRRFTLSVSPSPVRGEVAGGATSDAEIGSPSGKKRYIIRQTPSPSPKFPRAQYEPAQVPKLSVVSEVTLLPQLSSPMPVSQIGQRGREDEEERRMWAASMDNNNKPKPADRPSRAHYPSRARMIEPFSIEQSSLQGPSGSAGRNGSKPTAKPKNPNSKETMI